MFSRYFPFLPSCSNDDGEGKKGKGGKTTLLETRGKTSEALITRMENEDRTKVTVAKVKHCMGPLYTRMNFIKHFFFSFQHGFLQVIKPVDIVQVTGTEGIVEGGSAKLTCKYGWRR